MIEAVVGDIGGTNARFALARLESGRVSLVRIKTLRCADFPNLAQALQQYAQGLGQDLPASAAFAVAGPVRGQAIRFTNTGWAFSAQEIARAFGFAQVRLINDFTANAMALPVLAGEELAILGGPDTAAAGAQPVRAICGPGTGFGVSALVGDYAVQGEGGHSAFAPGDEIEDRLLAYLRPLYGRVSVERLLSGPGLADMDAFFAQEAGSARKLSPEEVTRRALDGSDSIALLALERFCAVLGAVSGDLALLYGAESGVFIAGGIAPNMLEFLKASRFRARFEDKGRLSYFVTPIPSYCVLRADLAMVGCAAALMAHEGGKP